jgi:hypothetical protein
MTTQEILETEEINPADLRTFDDFVRIANEYNEKYKDISIMVPRNWTRILKKIV